MGQPGLFFVYFRSFQTNNTIFIANQCVHPVYGARIQTHDLSNTRPGPLDKGSHPNNNWFKNCEVYSDISTSWNLSILSFQVWEWSRFESGTQHWQIIGKARQGSLMPADVKGGLFTNEWLTCLWAVTTGDVTLYI